jgi:hypothetical protein
VADGDLSSDRQGAREQGAEILWADETGIRSDHTTGTSWSPVRHTLVVKGTRQRFKTSMIAAISNTGTLHFTRDATAQ